MCLLFICTLNQTKLTFWPMQYIGGKDYSSPPSLWYPVLVSLEPQHGDGGAEGAHHS